MDNMVLWNSFLQTEMIYSEGIVIKAANTYLKIASRNPWKWQDCLLKSDDEIQTNYIS